jgi:stage III sporulation protein SpoIIIAA
MQQQRITDDLELMFDVLPPQVAEAVRRADRSEHLLEIVLDLGRVPEARFTDAEVRLGDAEVTQAEIEYVVSRVSAFDADNRAGIERTLHRISAIRNRRGNIVGLTCRVGRAVYGTIDIIEDIIVSGKSILMLGKPGVGKTTMLRESARVLADKKRVVIVDTSNEIGGDGDIPHPAVGRARRMQVPQPNLQHEVMIEAVENHMPEVIVIDEIGRELEAMAARTIAERGVQLIGTAHGRTLDNLLINPTLSDLVGGIESVTLSDEEARRRGTQKTVLERRAPPTFDVLVEIQDREKLLVHHDVAASVDNLVRGRAPDTELRYRDEHGNIHRTRPEQAAPAPAEPLPSAPVLQVTPPKRSTLKPVRVYAYGIAHNRLEQAAARLNLPVSLAEDMSSADIVMTVKNYYRRRPKLISDAERRNVPIYVLRANTLPQMESCLADIFDLSPEDTDPYGAAMQETQQAIQRVVSGERSVDLTPQNAFIRRLQHEAVREANLISHSYGKEPVRRVRVYRE